MKQKIRALRDHAKVQLHLAVLDAKKLWDEKVPARVRETVESLVTRLGLGHAARTSMS